MKQEQLKESEPFTHVKGSQDTAIADINNASLTSAPGLLFV